MLRRTPLKPGRVGLRRTGFKRKQPKPPEPPECDVEVIDGDAPVPGVSGIVRYSGIKRRGTKRKAEDSDPEYMAQVAALGCAICRLLGFGLTPAEVHHRRTGTGGGKRAPDRETCPLCTEHHRGNTGIHGLGRKLFERTYGVTELDLIEQTKVELACLWRSSESE